MKRMLWILLAVIALVSTYACTSKAKAPKMLVLYYSQTGNTKVVADEIVARLGADAEEILPVVPYDGSYQETIQRSAREREEGLIPDIQPLKSDLSQYDIIFLGYPIWFGTYAPPVISLLDQVNLNGKKVVPFCTFGSGGLDSSIKDLTAKFPEADILPGYGVRAARLKAVPDEVDRFLKTYGYLEGEFTKLEDFPAPHAVTEEESAIFDAALGTYPMYSARATEVAARNIPGGKEYLFTAEDKPREGAPLPPTPGKMKVYVTVLDGEAPEFTQVVR